MAKLKSEIDAIRALTEVTIKGFEQIVQALDDTREAQGKVARATYNGLTSSGKSRYVASLVKEVGSQAEVSRMLNITPGRVSQLMKSEKNRKNGK